MQLKTVLWILLIVSVSCGSGSNQLLEQRKTKEEAQVKIINRTWYDQRIFILTGTQRTRLGTVRASRNRSFPIPEYLVDNATPIAFIAESIGRNTSQTSQEFTVRPGEVVEFTIVR